VAAAIDHVLGERKRRISGQLGGKTVTRESERAVWLGENEVRLTVKRENGAIEVRIHDGEARASRVVSDWKPGASVWSGTVGGPPGTVQVRAIGEVFAVFYRG